MSKLLCPACDAPMVAKDGKRGGVSMSCGSCGYQGFARTPKAAAGVKAKMGNGSPAPSPAAKSRSIEDELT